MKVAEKTAFRPPHSETFHRESMREMLLSKLCILSEMDFFSNMPLTDRGKGKQKKKKKKSVWSPGSRSWLLAGAELLVERD